MEKVLAMRRFLMLAESCQSLPVESDSGEWVRYTDAERKTEGLRRTIAHACRIALFPVIYRYLLSHEEGRWSGYEKAQRHREMLQFYIAMQTGVSDPEKIDVTDARYKLLHGATRVVTDHLDEVLGFPLQGKPDYDRLVPLFFEAFHRIACPPAP